MCLSGTELVWRAGRDEILGASSPSRGLWSVDFPCNMGIYDSEREVRIKAMLTQRTALSSLEPSLWDEPGSSRRE